MLRNEFDANAGLDQEHILKGSQALVGNGVDGRPLDASLADGPNLQEHLRVGRTGHTLVNPQDLEGKITDDEGRQYTVRSTKNVRWSIAWRRNRNVMAIVVERLLAVIRR